MFSPSLYREPGPDILMHTDLNDTMLYILTSLSLNKLILIIWNNKKKINCCFNFQTKFVICTLVMDMTLRDKTLPVEGIIVIFSLFDWRWHLERKGEFCKFCRMVFLANQRGQGWKAPPVLWDFCSGFCKPAGLGCPAKACCWFCAHRAQPKGSSVQIVFSAPLPGTFLPCKGTFKAWELLTGLQPDAQPLPAHLGRTSDCCASPEWNNWGFYIQ